MTAAEFTWSILPIPNETESPMTTYPHTPGHWRAESGCVVATVDGVGPAVGYAASLLESIASVEGDGSDLATACEGMAALLRSLQPRPEPASPGDLLHLAALATREAFDGGSLAAASLRCDLTTASPDLYLVAEALRSAAGVVR